MEPYLTSSLYQVVLFCNNCEQACCYRHRNINCGVFFLSYPIHLCKCKCTVFTYCEILMWSFQCSPRYKTHIFHTKVYKAINLH